MLRFVHISDTHIGAEKDYMLYDVSPYQQAERLVEFINNQLPFEPDFVLHTGDVTYDPDAAAMALAAELLQQIKYPLYVVRGNHDSPSALAEHFEHLPPDNERLNYTFEINDFRFIVLDSFGREQPSGYLEDADLVFLEQTLQQNTARSIVIVVHHIPTKTGNAWLDERMLIQNYPQLFETLVPYRDHIRGIFFGHIHDFSTHYVQGMLCSSTSAAFSQFIYPIEATKRFMVTEPGGLSLVTLRHNGHITILHHLLGGR